MYNRVSYRTKRLLFEFIREFPISTILLVFDLLSISFICYIDAWDEVLRYGNNNVNYALLESVNRVAYFLKCNIFRENKIHECCGICSDCGICRECWELIFTNRRRGELGEYDHQNVPILSYNSGESGEVVLWENINSRYIIMEGESSNPPKNNSAPPLINAGTGTSRLEELIDEVTTNQPTTINGSDNSVNSGTVIYKLERLNTSPPIHSGGTVIYYSPTHSDETVIHCSPIHNNEAAINSQLILNLNNIDLDSVSINDTIRSSSMPLTSNNGSVDLSSVIVHESSPTENSSSLWSTNTLEPIQGSQTISHSTN